MIRFEHGMLVLDNTATKDDVNAVNEFAEFVRNEERERIIKLLEEFRNAILASGDIAQAQMLHTSIAVIKEDIALIKGETNE